MKVVILAGGMGTRLSEETGLKPKPMVEVGGRPILWHIMKTYSHFGFNDFIVCLGYKGHVIKEYFHHYYVHHADMTVDLANNSVEYHRSAAEPWKVTLVDTGLATMTGGRIKRVRPLVQDGTFMLTYGDGVGDVDVGELLRFHQAHGRLATVTAVQLSGRFGALGIDEKGFVRSFHEKPKGDGAWISGGYFVLEPRALEYIAGDETIWEHDPLERLAKDGELVCRRHGGFWKPMDTIRDMNELESMWASGKALWKVWR